MPHSAALHYMAMLITWKLTSGGSIWKPAASSACRMSSASSKGCLLSAAVASPATRGSLLASSAALRAFLEPTQSEISMILGEGH